MADKKKDPGKLDERLKPQSYPMPLEEALRRAMSVPPPKDGRKRKKPKKRAEKWLRPVTGPPWARSVK